MASKSMKEQLAKRLKENQERNESFGGIALFNDEDARKSVWKCGEGKHIIDILPYITGKNDPSLGEGEIQYVYEYYFHGGLGIEGKNSAMCLLKTYGKPCPICEDIQRMKRDGEDEEVIKAISVRRNPKSIYNILCWDKGEEKKGVQLFIVSHWFMGKHLLELATIPVRDGQEEIDPIVPFMDPDDGKSVYFRREGSGPNDTRFYGHQLLDRPKGFKISKKHLDDCFCLDEIIKIPTYEEVLEIYNEGIVDDEPKSSRRRDADDDERPSRRSKKDKEEKPSRRSYRDEEEDNDDGDDEKPSRKSRRQEEEEDDVSSDQCEFGHKFGYDANKYPDDCDECDQWKECVKKARKLKEQESDEDEDEKPKKSSRRSRRDEDEEDEDEKPLRRNKRDEEDEEDERPKKSSRRNRDDEDEDEAEKKKSSRRSRR